MITPCTARACATALFAVLLATSATAQDPSALPPNVLPVRVVVGEDGTVSVYETGGQQGLDLVRAPADPQPAGPTIRLRQRSGSTDARRALDLAGDEPGEDGALVATRLAPAASGGIARRAGDPAAAGKSARNLPNLGVYLGTGAYNTYLYDALDRTIEVWSTIANFSDVGAGFFEVGWYLSADKELAFDDIPFASGAVASLEAGSTTIVHAKASLDGVPRIVPGTYFILIVADYRNYLAESDETDNDASYLDPIDYAVNSRPNLRDYSGAGYTYYTYHSTNHVLRVSVAAANFGDVTATRFGVGWFLSADTEITTSDYLIAARMVTDLEPQEYVPLSVSAYLGGLAVPPGVYYVGIVMDYQDEVEESNENDNTVRFIESFPYRVSGLPNLYVYTGSGSTNWLTYYTSTRVLEFYNSVANDGSERSDAFKMGWYLSTDPLAAPKGILLATSTIPSLGVFTFTTRSGWVDLDAFSEVIGPGEYYFVVFADQADQVNEVNEADNFAYYDYAFDFGPDIELELHLVSDPSGVRNSADPGVKKTTFQTGETVRVTLRATNTSESVPIQVALSLFGPDGSVAYESALVGANSTADSPLMQDETDYYSFDWRVPSRADSGVYSLGASIHPEWSTDLIYDTTLPGPVTAFDTGWILADKFQVVPLPRRLVSLTWEDASGQEVSQVNEGQEVFLRLRTAGYADGESVHAHLFEHPSDVRVETKTLVVQGNRARAGWVAAVRGDSASTEYYFLVGAERSSSLTVQRCAVPAAPPRLVPADGATDVGLAPELAWEAVEGASGYRVQVATAGDFTDASVVVDDTVASAAYVVPPGRLERGARYHWRVRSVNACGEGAWSEPWSFDTIAAQLALSGALRACRSGAPVAGVVVQVSGEADAEAATGDDGAYRVEVAAGRVFTITPTMPAETPANGGITTLDLALARRHILGTATLDAPCQVVAADVNASASVTTLDVALMRRLILGVDEGSAAGSRWTFMNADQVFDEPGAPFPYEAVRRYDRPTADLDGQDFIAVKRGDVDGSWAAPGGVPLRAQAAVRNASQGGAGGPVLVLRLDEGIERAGRHVTVPVRAYGFRDVGGVQLTVEWDARGLAFEEIAGGGLPGFGGEHVGLGRVDEGLLPLAWDESKGGGLTLPDGAVLFTLRFRVADGVTAPVRVKLGSAVTPAAAHRSGDLSTVGVETVEAVVETGDVPVRFALDPNYPNPFNPETLIRYTIPEEAEVVLEVYDGLGRRVEALVAARQPAGAYEVRFEAADLPSGVYYCRLKAGGQVAVRAMLLLK